MAHDYSKILSEDTIRKAIIESCIIVHGQAVRYAPVDTGNLKNSLSYAVEGFTGGLNTGGGGVSAKASDAVDEPNGKNIGHVGTSVEYAAAVEYGRPDMPNYPMQPYLRPALATTKAKREKRLGEIIAEAIQGVVK